MTATVTTLISYRFRDGEGAETTEPHYYLGSEVNTVAEAQAIVTDMKDLMAAISGCAVVGAEVTFQLDMGTPDTDDPGYRVDAGGTLSFGNTAGRSPSGSAKFIPGLLLSRMVAGVVNDGDADIMAFQDAVVNGGGITGTFTQTDSSGLKLQDSLGGHQSTRKTKRRR
jgi:hypothetical protein